MPQPTEKQVRLPIQTWKLADKTANTLTKQRGYKVYLNALIAMAVNEYVENHPELQSKVNL